jgi:hypothetical protein
MPQSRRVYAQNLVNEFYKKGCQEKTSASTGGREDFGLEIQPTAYCALDALEGFSLFCLLFLSRLDLRVVNHAHRALKLGKQKLVLERQPWFYRRLVAYRYFWFSEGA